MISWMRGEKIDNWSQAAKHGIVISCSGVGYEVQLSRRNEIKTQATEVVTLWIHQVQRDDGYSLFGFIDRKERDLFRIIISVNGVGPQIGLAILEKFDADQLITILANKDIDTLTSAQGVGKRTAERLLVELKDKPNQFFSNTGAEDGGKKHKGPPNSSQLDRPVLEDLRITLSSLGYEKQEIDNALDALELKNNAFNIDQSFKGALVQDEIDALLKTCLLWLNKEKC